MYSEINKSSSLARKWGASEEVDKEGADPGERETGELSS